VAINSDLTFGPWLRQCRRALDLTHAELAAAVGCSVSALRKFEAGDLRPSKLLAEALASALAIAPQDRAAFVRFARDMPGDPPALLPVQSISLDHPTPAARVRSNLLVPPTALIGREQERVAVGHLLRRADTRLLTLTGSGGIGKTRLGLQVADDLLDAFVDGIYFVDLAPIRDANLIVSAIAQVLGLMERGDQPLDWSSSAIREQQITRVLAWHNTRKALGSLSLLSGDFNATPESSVYRFLQGQQSFDGVATQPWVDLAAYDAFIKHKTPAATLDFMTNPRWLNNPTLELPMRVDWLLLGAEIEQELPRVQAVELFGIEPFLSKNVVPSDHYGVYADLAFR
jgi:transcriptional regulator with XRE-family HTH domain